MISRVSRFVIGVVLVSTLGVPALAADFVLTGRIRGVENNIPAAKVDVNDAAVELYGQNGLITSGTMDIRRTGEFTITLSETIANALTDGKINFMFVFDKQKRFQSWGADAIGLNADLIQAARNSPAQPQPPNEAATSTPKRQLVIDPVLLQRSGPRTLELNLYQLYVYERIYFLRMADAARPFSERMGSPDQSTRARAIREQATAMDAAKAQMYGEFSELLLDMPKSYGFAKDHTDNEVKQLQERRKSVFALYGIDIGNDGLAPQGNQAQCQVCYVRRCGLFGRRR